MAELLGEAYVQVRADMKMLRPDLGRVGSSILGYFGNLKSQVAALLPFATVAGGIAAVAGELRAAMSEASSGADALKRLEATLTATKHAAGLSKGELLEHAESLRQLTGVADDEIHNFQAILLTFRNVQQDTFKRATELALDMAAVFGGDLSGKAIQLGKALQDPVHGMLALTRVGITFTDTQKQMVKDLVAAGRVAEAQALILDEIANQVGGAAAKMASGPRGELKRLQSDLSELREELGNKLLPFQILATRGMMAFTTAVTTGVDMANSAIQSLTDWFATLLPLQEAWSRAVFRVQVAWNNIAGAAAVAFGAIDDAMSSMLEMLDLEDRVASMIDWVSKFVLDASEWLNVLVLHADKVWKLLGTGVEWVASRFQDVFAGLGPFIIKSFYNFVETASNVLRTLPVTAQEVAEYFRNQFNLLGTYLALSLENAVNTGSRVLHHLPGAMQEVANHVVAIFKAMAAEITLAIVVGAETAMQLGGKIWEKYGEIILRKMVGAPTEVEAKAIADAVETATKAVEAGRGAAGKAGAKSDKGKASDVVGIADAVKDGIERQSEIERNVRGAAAGVPLPTVGLDMAGEHLTEGLRRQIELVTDLFAPSEKSKELAKSMADTLSAILLEKFKIEGKRVLPFERKDEPEGEDKDRPPPGDMTFSGDGGKGTTGFFGPAELAKKLQESMARDGFEVKMLGIADAHKKVAEATLTTEGKMLTALEKLKSLPTATV
jgi:hypothetical protein